MFYITYVLPASIMWVFYCITVTNITADFDDLPPEVKMNSPSPLTQQQSILKSKHPLNLVAYNNHLFIISHDSVGQEFRQDQAGQFTCP